MSVAELIAALLLLGDEHRDKTVLVRTYNDSLETDFGSIESVALNSDKSVVILEVEF